LGLAPPAKTDRHMTKTSIVSGIWKVFSMLLENTHQADYQLIVTRLTDGLKKQVGMLEA